MSGEPSHYGFIAFALDDARGCRSYVVLVATGFFSFQAASRIIVSTSRSISVANLVTPFRSGNGPCRILFQLLLT